METQKFDHKKTGFIAKGGNQELFGSGHDQMRQKLLVDQIIQRNYLYHRRVLI